MNDNQQEITREFLINENWRPQAKWNQFIMNRIAVIGFAGSLGDVDAWMEANASNKAWNACAIVKGQKYVFFKTWFGVRHKKEVGKENW